MPNKRYQPASIQGHETEIRQLVAAYLREATANPDYHAGNAVHDCVVYVMARKSPKTPRVDGSVVQPILLELVTMAHRPKAIPTIFPRAHATTHGAPETKPTPTRRRLKDRLRAAWNQLLS